MLAVLGTENIASVFLDVRLGSDLIWIGMGQPAQHQKVGREEVGTLDGELDNIPNVRGSQPQLAHIGVTDPFDVQFIRPPLKSRTVGSLDWEVAHSET